MRNFSFLLIILCLLSCSSNKSGTSVKTEPQTKVKKEGRKIYGKIVAKYLGQPISKEDRAIAKRPGLSFQIDQEYYLIKISNENLNEQELNNLIGKELKVRGKLIGDGWIGEASGTMPSTKGEKGLKKEENVGRIIIYEILEIIQK